MGRARNRLARTGVRIDAHRLCERKSIAVAIVARICLTIASGSVANYYDILAKSERNPDSAWNYASPPPTASTIQGCIVLWKGVNV